MNSRYIPKYGNKKIDRSQAIDTEVIFKTVEEYFELTRDEFMAKTKKIIIAYPRQVCIWLLAKHSVHGERGISVMFGFKDSGSAHAAVKAINDYLDTDEHVKDQIAELELRLMDSKTDKP